MIDADVRREFDRLLVGEDTLSRLLEPASAIVIFGSRAVGLAASESDWDVLCVGEGTRRDSPPGFDLVWIKESELSSDRWLGSELAGHIAEYGVVFRGDASWTARTFVSPLAIQLKVGQIECRLLGLAAAWHRLSGAYRRKHQRLVRLNLQRLDLLLDGQGVAPRPLLEASWARALDGDRELTRLRANWEARRRENEGVGRAERSMCRAETLDEILASMAVVASVEDPSASDDVPIAQRAPGPAPAPGR